MALAFAVWFERLARRETPPPWLGFATSQFDVAAISLGFISFLIASRPIVVSNSLVHYTMYFVALAGTGLRYDPRVCLAAGASALLQYGALITYVGLYEPAVWSAEPFYGTFQWDSQASRLQLIAVATIIHTAVVVRSRTFWLDSMRDQLTGLFNRGFFDESLARLLATRHERPHGFTLALIDLDHFKAVNDRHGHRAGDRALRFAADRLREAFRDDIIARYGGEEFAVILQVDRPSAVVRLDAWRAALHAGDRDPRLSASVGVASVPEDGLDAATLVELADRRLYAAKAAGRNRTIAEDHPAA